MSGAMIVGTLLEADAAVLAAVPATAIKLGRLPDGTTLPLLLVRTVSEIERQPLKRQGWVRRVERVSVAIRARSYREQKAILRLINGVCVGAKGDLAGCRRVSIVAAGVGPDVDGPGGSFEQTHDFRVSFDAPTAPQTGA
ncbi:tail completion protein gp17 [Sphingomonas hankookensis]